MSTTDHRKIRVFLSYAKEDFESVHEIYDRLKSEGWIEPWQDKSELLPGEHWTAAIKRAIDEADAVIIFLSDNSINKEGFVHYEMNYAWDRSLQKPPGTIYRIPIRLDNCDVPEDLYDLDSRQWVDYFESQKDETYEKLLRALKQRLDQKEKLEAKERARAEILAKKQAHDMVRIGTEEIARLDVEKVEQVRLAREKLEQKKAESEKIRLDAEKAEQARLTREELEKEKAERERHRLLDAQTTEQARIAREILHKENAEREKVRFNAQKENHTRITYEKLKTENGLLFSITKDFNKSTFVLIPVGILINILTGRLVSVLKLPIFLDSIGTVFVGVVCGPWAGALTGALANTFWSLFNPDSLPWWPVASFIGLVAGLCANAGLFKSWWKAILSGLLIALTAVITSTPIVIYLHGGITASGFSFITTYLIQTVQGIVSSVLSTSFLLEPVDKITDAILAFAILQVLSKPLTANFPRPENAELEDGNNTTQLIIALVIVVLALFAAFILQSILSG